MSRAAMDRILRRILAELGAPDLVAALGERLAASDLQSLLLAVMRRRAGRATPAGLLAQAERARLLAPSTLDARAILDIDRVAFDAARDFEAVELSPVAPFGVDAALGRIDANNVLATIRNVQVTADPTSALALVAAGRRRSRRSAEPLRLCASQRVIRLQPTRHPDHTPHFRLFAAVTAGRDTGDHDFEVAALADHVRVYLRLLRGLSTRGYRFEDVEVTISDTQVVRGLLRARGLDPDALGRAVRAHDAAGAARVLSDRGVELPADLHDPEPLDAPRPLIARLLRLRDHLVAPLRAEFPEARFRIDCSRLVGLGYYVGPCLHLWARDREGHASPIADGGLTNWTAALLSDRKERFFTSGIGTELIAKRYRIAAPG